jgi:hypothetical protein
MEAEFFDKVLQERIDKTIHTLSVKAKEYRRNNNPMHNFEKAAQFGNTTKERALWGFALKHYTSFMDILDDIEEGKIPSETLVDEKIGDLINYLILCEASIKERINNQLKPV